MSDWSLHCSKRLAGPAFEGGGRSGLISDAADVKTAHQYVIRMMPIRAEVSLRWKKKASNGTLYRWEDR